MEPAVRQCICLAVILQYNKKYKYDPYPCFLMIN